MRHNEHKRHKMGQMPGDIFRREKIRLLEGIATIGATGWQIGSERHVRAFQHLVIEKRKSQQRMRDKEMIRRGLNENKEEDQAPKA